MDEWGKFDETSLPEKEEFYSNLNLEDLLQVRLHSCKKILHRI